MREGYPPFEDRAGWPTTTLETECSFITKGTTPTTCGFGWNKTGVPFLRSECVGEDGFTEQGMMFIGADAHRALSRSEVRKGDILVTITGNVGRVAVFPYDEGNINQHIARVRLESNSQLDAKYLRHVLSTQEYRAYFNNIVTGLAYPQISLAQVREARVYAPHIDEQRRIAAILDASEAAIRTTEAVIEKLKAQRVGLLSGRVAAFTNHPETCHPAPLAEITSPNAPVCYGVVQPGTHYRDGVPLVTITDMMGDLDQGLHRISRNLDAQYARSRVVAGDLLLSIKATIGRLRVLPPGFAGNISRDIARIRCSERVVPAYLLFFFQSAHGHQSLASIQVGSTRAELSISRLLKVKVPVPDLPVQNEIIAVVGAADSAISTEEGRLAKLRLQHQGLLYDLLTGRVRTVREASV